MTERELKALEIAAKAKLQRSGDRWFVPAQTGKRGTYYTVKPDTVHPHCTCPDFESRQLRCKHIFAVEYTIEREQTSDGESLVTETQRYVSLYLCISGLCLNSLVCLNSPMLAQKVILLTLGLAVLSYRADQAILLATNCRGSFWRSYDLQTRCRSTLGRDSTVYSAS